VHLSEEKSVKTTINIKKENIISAGRVIDMDKLVSKDFSTLQTLHNLSVDIFHLNRCDLVGIINCNSFHLNIFNLFSDKILKINSYKSVILFENNIRLQHLVFGYKIFDKEYFHLYYFLAILAFTIY
jgi:hypothetical protein